MNDGIKIFGMDGDASQTCWVKDDGIIKMNIRCKMDGMKDG